MNVSLEWYRQLANMKVEQEMNYPEYDSLRSVMLLNGKWQLELIEKNTSFTIEQYVPDYSLNVNPLIGISKISFMSDDLDALYEKTKSMNAKGIRVLKKAHQAVIDFLLFWIWMEIFSSFWKVICYEILFNANIYA